MIATDPHLLRRAISSSFRHLDICSGQRWWKISSPKFSPTASVTSSAAIYIHRPTQQILPFLPLLPIFHWVLWGFLLFFMCCLVTVLYWVCLIYCDWMLKRVSHVCCFKVLYSYKEQPPPMNLISGHFSLITQENRICSEFISSWFAVFSNIFFPQTSTEISRASLFASLQVHVIFCVPPLLRCIYKGCGSMEMKTERAF